MEERGANMPLPKLLVVLILIGIIFGRVVYIATKTHSPLMPY